MYLSSFENKYGDIYKWSGIAPKELQQLFAIPVELEERNTEKTNL
jgi:hypothetical protein